MKFNVGKQSVSETVEHENTHIALWCAVSIVTQGRVTVQLERIFQIFHFVNQNYFLRVPTIRGPHVLVRGRYTVWRGRCDRCPKNLLSYRKSGIIRRNLVHVHASRKNTGAGAFFGKAQLYRGQKRASARRFKTGQIRQWPCEKKGPSRQVLRLHATSFCHCIQITEASHRRAFGVGKVYVIISLKWVSDKRQVNDGLLFMTFQRFCYNQYGSSTKLLWERLFFDQLFRQPHRDGAIRKEDECYEMKLPGYLIKASKMENQIKQYKLWVVKEAVRNLRSVELIESINHLLRVKLYVLDESSRITDIRKMNFELQTWKRKSHLLHHWSVNQVRFSGVGFGPEQVKIVGLDSDRMFSNGKNMRLLRAKSQTLSVKTGWKPSLSVKTGPDYTYALHPQITLWFLRKRYEIGPTHVSDSPQWQIPRNLEES